MSRDRHYLKPGWLTNRVVTPAHAVRDGSDLGRARSREREWRTVPVNVLDLDGHRYLVAPRGHTEWVRNLRVTGRGELRRRARVEAFRATELPDREKLRIIEAYLARWGYQVRRYFTALPRPSDHPVFRIDRL
jgi:hypothetical protein